MLTIDEPLHDVVGALVTAVTTFVMKRISLSLNLLNQT